MIRYLEGFEFSDRVLVDGVSVFRKGCFNCTHCSEKYNDVRGKCDIITNPDYSVWKDFTCPHHNPVVPAKRK
jgi:hypothetical protein